MSSRTKRRPPGTVKILCDKLNLSRQRVTALLAAGMPDEPNEARRWRESQSRADSVEELRLRRIALLRQQERRAKIDADKAAGQLMDRAEHTTIVIRCATAARCALWSLIGILPPEVAGLDEPQIAQRLEVAFRDCLTRLADGDAEFWDSAKGRRISELIEQEFPSPTKP
jgi:hypothetical protein